MPCMPTLDDLPPYRRATVLWRWAHLSVYELDRMVQEAAGKPCWSTGPAGPASATTAVLGDDERFHLMRHDEMLCTAKHRRLVHPEPEGVPPDSVPQAQRCLAGDYGTFHFWPPAPARTAPVRRMRAALVDALGPDCHLCGALPGSMVDHDYATGVVRGLLCALCNRVVEECLHVDGCARADYMNNPPAAHLKIPYPPSMAWRPKESTRQQKIELLGFDSLADWRPSRSARTRRHFPVRRTVSPGTLDQNGE